MKKRGRLVNSDMPTLLTSDKERKQKLPEYVLVMYPGVVKSADAAIRSLGGERNISANHFDGRSLDLRYRPNNLYANRMVSDRGSPGTSNLGTSTILAIAKMRRKKSEMNCREAQIIGMVSTVYSFKGLSDFQYLPIRKSEAHPDSFEDLVPKLIPLDLCAGLSWWNYPDIGVRTRFHLPPYQFSRYAVPSTKLLCKERQLSAEKLKAKCTGHGQSLRSERKSLTRTVYTTAEFPQQPSEEAVNDANMRCKNLEPHCLMQKLFENRPLWTRVGIAKKTGLEDNLIKTLLQKYAFYILNGPWGRLWCRFGYDPRIDPEARQYQSVMVTFRQHSKIPEKQRLKIVNKNGERSCVTHVSVTNRPLLPIVRTPSRPLCGGSVDYIYTPGKLFFF
ncbi:unnamed protein product [Thelazia callipaeda]|uniref:General transcription factor 3C polypeptide 5 n=1 Tax=Thelazia callipaeda TaxID=103827 RepID=A0A158RCY1_THECL|nr:unnamed protein product [Thelazia callipaeda]